MIPLSICARTVSGFTMIPQSTAQTTRWTRTSPALETDTSATWAMYVSPNACNSEIPLPAGRGRGISLLHAFGETYIAQVAEVSAGRQRLAPPRLLGGELEHRLGTRRLV